MKDSIDAYSLNSDDNDIIGAVETDAEMNEKFTLIQVTCINTTKTTTPCEI
jgi:hypothetical protein